MSFLSTIQNIREGALADQLTEELHDVLEGVEETGKAGSITLTLKIKPNGESAVTIEPSVAAKVPKPTVGSALFFVSGGNLVRRNPKQMDIEDELAAKRAQKETD